MVDLKISQNYKYLLDFPKHRPSLGISDLIISAIFNAGRFDRPAAVFLCFCTMPLIVMPSRHTGTGSNGDIRCASRRHTLLTPSTTLRFHPENNPRNPDEKPNLNCAPKVGHKKIHYEE